MDALKKKQLKAALKKLGQKLTFGYRLELVNEDEQRDVTNMRVSIVGAFFTVVAAILAVAALTLYLYQHSSIHKDAISQEDLTRRQIIENELRLDSLDEVLQRQDVYLVNLQNILIGKLATDSLTYIDSIVTVDASGIDIESSDLEREFSLKYEEAERYNISAQSEVDIQSRGLYRPAPGIITAPYDAQKKHYGVDVAAKPNESVLSVLDGTVIMTGYTAESGNVMYIHHSGDLISVYKYCGSLLKHQGDRVRAGEVIALVSKSASTSAEGSHLHFELWYEGQPLNPEKYIVFQ